MVTTAFMLPRFFAQTQLFSVSLSITVPSTPSKPRTDTKGTRLMVDSIACIQPVAIIASAQASTERQIVCEVASSNVSMAGGSHRSGVKRLCWTFICSNRSEEALAGMLSGVD